jgi:hypothetical protein
MKKNILFSVITLLFPLAVSAQSIEEIKNNPDYKWGEGTGITIDEAEREAMRQLVEGITVSVMSGISKSDSQTERDGTRTINSDVNMQLKTFSFAKLSNLGRRVLSPEPDAKMFLFIAQKDVDEMYVAREKKILSFIDAGKKAESRLQIDDALRYYYWALALATANPKEIYADINDQKENIKLYLHAKITSVLKDLDVKFIDGEAMNNSYLTKLRFMYNEQPVASLQYRYFDGEAYMGPNKVKDGHSEAELVRLPGDSKINITYEIRFANEAASLDEELKSVYDSNFARIGQFADKQLVQCIGIIFRDRTDSGERTYHHGELGALLGEHSRSTS